MCCLLPRDVRELEHSDFDEIWYVDRVHLQYQRAKILAAVIHYEKSYATLKSKKIKNQLSPILTKLTRKMVKIKILLIPKYSSNQSTRKRVIKLQKY